MEFAYRTIIARSDYPYCLLIQLHQTPRINLLHTQKHPHVSRSHMASTGSL